MYIALFATRFLPVVSLSVSALFFFVAFHYYYYYYYFYFMIAYLLRSLLLVLLIFATEAAELRRFDRARLRVKSTWGNSSRNI